MSATQTEVRFSSDGLELVGQIARPAATDRSPRPGLLLCHQFPSVPGGASFAPSSNHELGLRIASTLNWTVLSFGFRGCGQSEGDFSLGAWLRDVQAALACFREEPFVRDIWVCGFGTGGALAVCAAAEDHGVRGVATFGSPAYFEDWAASPRRLLEFAKETQVIRQPGFPSDFDAWATELRRIRPLHCAESLGDASFMVVHGTEDGNVPMMDARLMVDAHGATGGRPEFRFITGASHDLRLDPRAVASLLGWLDRQWSDHQRRDL